MAMPTARPTRWPTPINASEKLVDTCVDPAPSRKDFAATPATTPIAASKA